MCGWVALALGCGAAAACAHAVEPNYDEGVSFTEAGGGSGGALPVSSGVPSATNTSPSVPASGGGGSGPVSASGGAVGMSAGGTGGANNVGSGGVSASGGGSASGGAPPMGGSTSSVGGAPGLGDAFECTQGVVGAKSFEVKAKSNTGSAPTNQISLVLNLRHTGVITNAVPLNELSIRYWFNADGVTNLVADCDYAVVGCTNVRTRFVSASSGGADTYLEVGFVGAAGSLMPNFETGEIQLRFHNANYQGSLALGNDPSSAGLGVDYAVQTAIPAYQACQLVWGTEPLAN